jgi:hypothetical protein
MMIIIIPKCNLTCVLTSIYSKTTFNIDLILHTYPRGRCENVTHFLTWPLSLCIDILG